MKIPRLRKPTLKRLLPTRLFARALLILLLPVIVLQLSVAYVFYDRHWESIVRNVSSDLAAQMSMIAHEYDRTEHERGIGEALAQAQRLARPLGIQVAIEGDPKVVVENGAGHGVSPELYNNLEGQLPYPFMVQSFVSEQGERMIRVRQAVSAGALDFIISSKRIASSTTLIFISWMTGSTVLLMAIAVLFLRNQIRPIVQLARAAEQFGLGQEVADFSPKGASEIRRAATAFLIMADRIRRSVASRTEMLAGISHDLRTPLTRMKLEIEMGKIDTATRDALATDIDEMRRMIDEYLDFARGDAGEPMVAFDIAQLLAELVELYRRQGKQVALAEGEPAVLMVRLNALRRALQNIIDNALRYGGEASVSLEQTVAFVRIKVADRGPGIPEHEFETVFKPFTRLEASRNVSTGGVGLGLSIARDIAQGHGGDITLENQRDEAGKITGLSVTLRLPRELPR